MPTEEQPSLPTIVRGEAADGGEQVAEFPAPISQSEGISGGTPVFTLGGD